MLDHILRSAVYFEILCVRACMCVKYSWLLSEIMHTEQISHSVNRQDFFSMQNHKQENVLIGSLSLSLSFILLNHRTFVQHVCNFYTGAKISLTLTHSRSSSVRQVVCVCVWRGWLGVCGRVLLFCKLAHLETMDGSEIVIVGACPL